MPQNSSLMESMTVHLLSATKTPAQVESEIAFVHEIDMLLSLSWN